MPQLTTAEYKQRCEEQVVIHRRDLEALQKAKEWVRLRAPGDVRDVIVPLLDKDLSFLSDNLGRYELQLRVGFE